jgi:Ca2+-binding EF-hand superfamily protein
MDKWKGSQDKLNEWMKSFDTNGDGEISPDEFFQGLSNEFKERFEHDGEDDDEEDFDYVFNQL